ncbi:MAG: class I SAM-dependent methyltransferase [Nitrosopumilus sp.]|jgi:2-polyprenyl-3-methyl-5-hydroxy-6-metoxy-1,4-benzoquinol methylase|nr:class I SAM-dependent methyltransferase [Nitrosopumilus sp.]
MDIRKSIRAQYLKLLDREPDLDDLDYYFTELETHRIELDDLKMILRNSNEFKELVKHQKTPELHTTSIDTYNDIRIKGKTISTGYRNSEERYEEIFKFCKQFNRPISVLDLGAAEGYFTFRLAEDFSGVFIAVESNPERKLLELCVKNNNRKVLLLDKQMNLKNLKNLKEVQHFDIVLALNIIHHFDEPFQDVLDTLVSMSSFCFMEHPNPLENDSTKNSQRLEKEKLKLDSFEPILLNKNESGLGNTFNQKLERNLWLLKNTQPKTIDRGWRGSSKYDEEFGPGNHISIKSNFDNIEVDYGLRNEKRIWIQGIDLRTFLENNGVYPTNDEVLDLINNLKIDNAKDLGPHNLILNGESLFAIDQDDKLDAVNTKEKLKDFLKQSGLL